MIPNSTRWMSLSAFSAVVAAMLSPAAAHAVLVHRYTFNGNANDSVGTANATVVNAAPNNGIYLNGSLVVTGNTGQASNPAPTADAYVDLPNGVISQAAQAGTSGALSLEWWATIATQRTWQRLGDFGTSAGGENVSDTGATTNYIQITPNSGRFNNGLEATNHISTGAEPSAGLAGPFPVGREQHVVAVYDKTNTNGGANLGGTMSVYLQGALVATGPITPEFDLNALNDNNNWLGRSQWPDPVFDGTFNEFSIYSHALTQADVTANFNAGPVGGSSGAVLTINRDTGAVSLSNTGTPIRLGGYSIRSARGTLASANWASVSGRLDSPLNGGNGSFDSDDLWFVATAPDDPKSTVVSETMNVDGVGDDGGQLGSTALTVSASGKRLWQKFFVEDVTAVVQAILPNSGGTLIDLPVAVNFIGNGGVAWKRSDLNFDNAINAADYIIFRDNHRKPIDAMLTDPESYVFGDIDGDQDNDFTDFRLFQSDYKAANPAGAFEAMIASVGGVPEPSSAALLAIGVSAAVLRRRRVG